MKEEKNYQIKGIPGLVKITGYLTSENSGIGSYEYCGIKGYDKGIDYLELEDVKWDEALYTKKQNEKIMKFVYDNWADIEKHLENYAKGYN